MDTKDGKLQPVGQTYDCLDIVEYLMDIVINLEKTQEGIIAKVKKSRLANLPDILPVENFSSILEAIESTKASSINKREEKVENIEKDNSIEEIFETVVDEITTSSENHKFDYEEMKRLQKKHLEDENEY